ncbi:dedicator of cytokinesis protein 3-like [Denticeps clupeoides]|uniref:dedicator of cytokinesis protein 3-like n=1 Tax=Denticeps clupeoides TaxID=299321 RepID=UPI0010A4D450|nr:dedicator of cytokinesis protein 3-like [Denticeps clupeoides]
MWAPTEEEKIGVVICSFRSSVLQALHLEIGETVQILEKCEGWYRGFSTKKPAVKGIFPANYVHLKKATVTNRGQGETVVPLEDPIITETTSTLQEWAVLWKQLYVKHRVELFQKLRHVMTELIDLRRQLISGHMTQDQTREIKRHITLRLDWGNEHLGLDLVPRKEFEMVDADHFSVCDLYKMHVSSRHCGQPSSAQGDTRQRHGDSCRVPVAHHLFLNLKSFTYSSINEDTDVMFILYDARDNKYISERFLVKLNKNGGPKSLEKADGLCALFTDLSSKDLKRDLYIVVHVIRTGRMLLNDSKKGPAHVQYRRPFGCAVLSMTDVFSSITDPKEEKDFVLKVYTCNNENEWFQIQENIIRKSSTKYSTPSTNYGLVVSLQLFRGELDVVRRENPLIFARGAVTTRKLGFPDVMQPGDSRNDLYLTLERGEFERGGKSVQKNIEVTVFVLYADGEVLKDCLSTGCGEPCVCEHRSFVLYHNNSPRWSETLKLSIPLERFRGSHLRFEFRHCSTKDKGEKKLFGFSFTPLMREDGTTLADDSHELYVYKCDDSTVFSNQGLYLSMPCCRADLSSAPAIPASFPFQRSGKESFWISTQLVSTKLTQNVDLLTLLKWKAHPERVLDVLGRLRLISGEEIVKFLQDILDTLFCLLDDNTDKYGPLVFQSLVFIINLLRDWRYYHFRPVIDAYIQNQFAGALAYKELIRCLKWYMDRSAEVVRQDHIQDAMRALEYLFKFIVQSRALYSRATCGLEEESFRASIHELFHSIRFVLSLDGHSSETLVCTQAALLNSFPDIFDELLQMFTVQEVAELVRGTLASMPSTVDMGQSLDVVKLQSIARTVDSRLFYFPESRSILLPVVLHHIHLHLRQQRELLVCSGILASIFSTIKSSSMDSCVAEEVDMLVESLLDVLLQTLLSIMSKSQALESSRGPRCPQCTAEITGEYVSCLLSLLRLMTELHFHHLLNNFHSKDELKEFLLKIFCVFRNLMKLSVFPRDWSVMRLLTSHIIIATTQYLTPALQKTFSDSDFDFKVWNSFFSLAVLYISQPSLQLESLSPIKKKRLLDKYGDMRVMMAYELFSMWQKLGEDKQHFTPGMMGPFLGVALVPQPEVRNIIIPIFHDMMNWEQRKSGNFKQVEAELMDKLDSMVSDGKGDENHRELFSLLTQLFGPYPSLLEKMEQETWRESGVSFVTSVTRLIERLLDYRESVRVEDIENKRFYGSMNILNFYKSEVTKEDMYIRYIHKLCELHLQAENFTEAGFTLLLYWELLQWDDRALKEFLHYPAQSEWQRKEALSRKVLHYFNKGKCWEYGISLCRELAFQYEILYDYHSLSWIRKMEASYYDNIIEQQRVEPEFFRMGFYGRKFPFFLRNKEFVCRGYDYERLEDFQQRMLNEFPQAIAIQHPNQPDDTILQSDAQYLQIYAVTPVCDLSEGPHLDRVPERIKRFYRSNNVSRFHYDRPFHKGPKDRDNEFRSLWIERTTLILTRPLPGISRWFEVERREVVEVSPLENAIYVVENKNQELRALISQYQHRHHHGNVNLLSMCLNGVVDAAVNGGIARYQEAFFDKDFIGSHPEETDRITQLKDLMLEQLHILGVGLSLHEKLVHPEMRPLHKKLIDQFHLMRSSLYHGIAALDRLSPACSGMRGVVTHSPESSRFIHRHSPLNVRLSGEVAPLMVMTDGLIEHTEEPSHMQPSPSSSSLSSIRSSSSQIINSTPSSARGSPSLPDKGKNNRELLMLLPPHRERPSPALHYNPHDPNGQVNSVQRGLQQGSPCKPCGDRHIGLPERGFPAAQSNWSAEGSEVREAGLNLQNHGSMGTPLLPPRNFPQGHFLMHFDTFQQQMNELPPALPMRSLRKSPLHPIPGSPPSPLSVLGGSNSTLSGSASSGVSSLSESIFSHSDAPSRPEPLEPPPSSHFWSPEEPPVPAPYLHVHYASAPDHLHYPASGGADRTHAGPEPDALQPDAPCQPRPLCQELPHPAAYHPCSVGGAALPRRAGPPTVPPKPGLRGGVEEEAGMGGAQQPVPLPRRIFPPPHTHRELHRAAWEQRIREEQEENAG